MKKFIFYILLLLIHSQLILAASPYDDVAKKILNAIVDKKDAVAVLPFDSEDDPAVGDAVANELISALTEQGVTVVERRSMNKILNELSLQQTGIIDEATVSKLGKSLGARYIVTGTAKEFNRPGYTNVGLKIQARLVDVESGKILASGKTEVEKSDITVAYKRREASGPLRYPAMLGITFGINFVENYFDDYELVNVDNETNTTLSGMGFEIGIQYFPEKNNFFGSLWEFYYYQGTYSEDNDDWNMKGGALAWNLILRIPVWRIIDHVSFLTHLYLGPGIGYGYYSFIYDKDDDYYFKMHRFFINVKAGLIIGLTDNILFGAQYTYNPDAVAGGTYTSGSGADSDSNSGQAEIKGHEVHFSIIFTP